MPDLDIEKMDVRDRILFEMERLLKIEDEELKIETIRKNKIETGRPRMPNRDLYRMYKAISRSLGVEQTIIYTGNSILEDWEGKKDLEEETIADLEASLNFD